MTHGRPAFLLLAALCTVGVAQESKYPLNAAAGVLPVTSAPFQRLFDYDGDGDLDAVGTRVFGSGALNEVTVWRNDLGAYTAVHTGAVAHAVNSNGPRSFVVACGDFDRDGFDDFVVSGGSASEVWLTRPGPTFAVTSYPMTNFSRRHAVITGDFDGDGGDDWAVAVLESGGVLWRVDVHLGAGGMVSATVPGNNQIPVLLAGDLLGNGGKALLLAGEQGPTATILSYANGALVAVQTLNSAFLQGGGECLWVSGDVDGDGDEDVVVFQSSSYQCFRRTGPSTYAAEAIATGGPAEFLADVDGDGDLDGVCCSGGGPVFYWPELDFASTYQIAINRGNGDFAPAFGFPGCGSEQLAGAADIDSDGDVDLVAGRCVFYGRGPWTGTPQPLALGNRALEVLRPWLIRDADRDGDLDLCAVPGQVGAIAYNDGTGVFTARSSMVPPAGRAFGAVTSIDVDGDGARDWVVDQYQNSILEAVAMFRNNGGGHFTPGAAVMPPGQGISGRGLYPDTTLPADIDGDGDEDLIVNAYSPGTEAYGAQIWWNQQGTMVAGPSYNGLDRRRIEAVADFNGDGIHDLLMSGRNPPIIERGTGNPAAPFVSEVNSMFLGFAECQVLVADVNDDGKPDVIGPGGNTILLYVNTSVPGGAISFTQASLPVDLTTWLPYAFASPTCSVTAGDFDGDGRTDIAAVGFYNQPHTGVVLLRRTDSPVPTIADYEQVTQMFVNGFACDIDGDGDDDLVGSYVTRSVQHHGITAGRSRQSLAGTVGEAGAVPVLGASGPFRGGEVEQVLLSGIPGPTFAVLAMSLGTGHLSGVPLPGMEVYLDLGTVITSTQVLLADGQGRAAGSAAFPVLLPHGLLGLTIHSQGFVFDAAAASGISCTNLLTQQFGL
ncbi:MAG: FG-GAP repeat domain-containing protein [Planctomycetota bacterium]